MLEKNLVDDYYSSIDSASSESKTADNNSKPKIKAKKVVKKIVKKVEEKNISSVSLASWNSESSFEPKPIKNSKSVPQSNDKKSFVQKVSIVKPRHKNTPTKPSTKKETNFSENKTNNTPNHNWKFSNIKNSENNIEKKNKNFWEDKIKWGIKKWEKKNYDSAFPKKSKWFSKNKTRWKFKFYEQDPIDTSFTRSNKIAKSLKQEKKVEDIKQNLTLRSWETITIPEVFSLKEFSEKIWVPLVRLIAEFMKNGMMVNINSKIDFDSACIIAESFEVKLEKDNSKWVSVKDLISGDIADLLIEDDSSRLKQRPPVVSIMWHVDHWKTSLLDIIRESKVVLGEAWWITQSIWAYQVEQNWKKLTFLDTPWHEAFTVMRSRWAKATDIAILVVAADEWVKPQTLESISHAKQAQIPVIVAINKMDKDWANPDHVKWQLSENWLTPEDWGWDTPMIPVSAKSWFWIDELLEILILVADMKELKANPDRAWVATVIESHLDKTLWPVATVLVNTWNINKWDNIVCNDSFGKIRTMKNFENRWLLKAFPWDPILIIWLDKVVNGWDVLQVVANSSIARSKSLEYSQITSNIKKNETSGLDVLMSRIKAWNLKQLKILVKADTNWSLEAIKSSLLKLSTDDTSIVIIHSWVGNITQWDVLMVNSSQAILVWFNIWLIPSAKKLLEKSFVEYINSKVIYHITERIEKIVNWMLDPKEIEISLWESKVLAIFYTDKKFLILWVSLPEWNKIEKDCSIRVIRKNKKVWEWRAVSLKQWVEEVKELEWPLECWIRFEWKLDIQEWDMLELYKIEIQK